MEPPQRQDPILRDARSFLADLDRYCDQAAETFDGILSAAAALNDQARDFHEEFFRLTSELDRRSVYNSTILTEWIAALGKGLNLVRAGASPDLLDYYTRVEEFRRCAALEFPERIVNSDVMRVCIHGRINVIPLDYLVGTPRMGDRVNQSMPGYPSCRDYVAMDIAQLERVADHFSASLDMLREFDPFGYGCLLESIHSIYACVFRIRKNTMGGRDDSRGSVIAGISEERIEHRDTISTAAELYHEHCHLKLSIFCHVRQVRWPEADTMISPFKNENRSFKWVLHTVYTVGIECGMRLDLIGTREPEARRKEMGFLASVAYRLDLLRRIYGACSEIAICPEFWTIGEMTGEIISRIFERVKSVPSEEREAHRQERERVMTRHIWDIGQFLLRDVQVEDPGLGAVRRVGNRVVFQYEGEWHQATLEPGRCSAAVYGDYLDKIA